MGIGLYAQDTLQLEDVLQETIQDQPGAAEFNTYLERLKDLQQHPINLNKATYEDLEQLVEFNLLTPQQAAAILAYRQELGRFSDVAELQAVPGLDMQTIQRILPFVTVKKDVFVPSQLGQYVRQGRHQILIRANRLLEKQAGFLLPDTHPDRFLGDPWRLYTRYQFRHRFVSWGFTGEKDPGEPFFSGPLRPPVYAPWKGFDFFSAYLEVRPGNTVRQVIVGDYEVRWGQGLVAWTGFAFGKSSYVMNFKRVGYELKPYTSVNEVKFLRGLAAAAQVGRVRLTGVVSRKYMDARLSNVPDEVSEDTLVVATYLSDYGYHRNLEELSRKGNIRQDAVGGRVAYEFAGGHIGVHGMHIRLSTPLGKYRDQPYNLFEFRGDRLTNVGVSYEYTLHSWHFYGETALSFPGKWATINGLLVSLDRRTDIGLVYRYYHPAYHHLLGRPWGEYYKGFNEEGLYWAMQIRPVKGLTLSGYLDLYRHPWLRYERDAPTRGHDHVVKAEYRPAKRSYFYILLKDERRQENYWRTRYSAPVGELVWVRMGYLRFHLKHDIDRNLSYRTRFQMSFYDAGPDPTEFGYMMYHELKYRLGRPKMTLYGRIAYFETSSWRTRIYVYETDVLYYFSVPALYGHGIRYYVMTSWYINRHLTLWLRLARTRLFDRESIGSGLHETQGPARTEVKIQARIRF